MDRYGQNKSLRTRPNCIYCDIYRILHLNVWPFSVKPLRISINELSFFFLKKHVILLPSGETGALGISSIQDGLFALCVPWPNFSASKIIRGELRFLWRGAGSKASLNVYYYQYLERWSPSIGELLGIILPSYMGNFLINHYNDPYKTTSNGK